MTLENINKLINELGIKVKTSQYHIVIEKDTEVLFSEINKNNDIELNIKKELKEKLKDIISQNNEKR